MGRYSPTVLPQATPGFAQNLADALTQGVQSYEHFKDKRQARDDRDRELMDREDQLVLHGIMPAGWTPPAEEGDGSFVESKPSTGGNYARNERPSGVAPGFSSELEGALAAQPGGSEGDAPAQDVTEPAAPRSASGHPGGWDPVSRSFVRVPTRYPEPVQLPSGRVYDAGGQMRNAVAMKLLEQEGSLDLDRRKRGEQVAERRAALSGLRGQPGYEKLTDALVEAGAQDPTVFNELVKNDPKAWHPGSMAEALSLSSQEAEARAAAEERHRAPPRDQQQGTAADQFAYRAVASTYESDPAFFDAHPELLPRYAQDAGAQDITSAKKYGVNRTHYYSAARRFADRLTAKSKPEEDDDAFMAMVLGQQPPKDPGATHSRTLPSQQSAPAGEAPTSAKGDIKLKAPPAPDSLLNELDQDYNGDLEKIRAELRKRGYDPDA